MDHIDSNNSDEREWELVIDEDDRYPSYIEEHQRHLHTQQSLDLCLLRVSTGLGGIENRLAPTPSSGKSLFSLPMRYS